MADSASIIAQPGAVFPSGPLPLGVLSAAPKADPKKEYLAGGYRPRWPGGGFSSIAAHAAEAGVEFGPELWELMDTDGTCAATLTTLAASIVCEGIQFYPALQDDPDAGLSAAEESDATLAHEIAGYWERVASDPRLALQHTLFRWVRAALKRGVKLIEQTYELAGDGPDRGKLVPKSFKIKPNWAWSFVLDVHGNELGLVGAVPTPSDPDTGTGLIATDLQTLLPRSKFAVLTFGQEDDDPRGQSVYRAAYTPWDEKVKLPKERWKFLSRFGTPTWKGLTSPEAQDVPVLDAQGNDTGKTQSAQQSLLSSLLALENATAIVAAAGSEIECVEPQGDGSAFRLAADDCRREIVFAILCQVRATLESQYGSKADSESGQDIMGTVVRSAKHWVASTFKRDVVYPGTALNWGEATARRLTPHVTLGRTDHQDFTATLRALAVAWHEGMFYESMLPQILASLNYRVPRKPGPRSGPVVPPGPAPGDPSSQPPTKPQPRSTP